MDDCCYTRNLMAPWYSYCLYYGWINSHLTGHCHSCSFVQSHSRAWIKFNPKESGYYYEYFIYHCASLLVPSRNSATSSKSNTFGLARYVFLWSESGYKMSSKKKEGVE